MPSALPAPPKALAAIIKAASDPDMTADTLARLVSADPSFAGMVLQVANTARFRGARSEPVTDVRFATKMLGGRTLRNYALCHAARSCASAKQLVGFDLAMFWNNSLRRAVSCELLAEATGVLDPSEAFTMGLLLDLGVVALVLRVPAAAAEALALAELDTPARLTAEKNLFGTTHTEIAAELAVEWYLPEVLALPMLHHHEPDRAPAPLVARCRIAMAGDLLAAVPTHPDVRAALQRARTEVPILAGLAAGKVDLMLGAVHKKMRDAAAMMSIKVMNEPTFDDVLHSANRSLVEANLSYEDLVHRLEQLIVEKEALAAELDRRNQELVELSRTDALTGVANRRELFRRLSDEVRRVARYGGSAAVLLVDIDHFKRVNDTWGHVVGDRVLTAVAHALRARVRATDLVARAGGEEFAVLLPSTALEGANQAAEQLRATVFELFVPTPKGEGVHVTISVGVAWIDGALQGPLDPAVVSTRLYDAADQALYVSKQQGRNRVTSPNEPTPWPSAVDGELPVRSLDTSDALAR